MSVTKWQAPATPENVLTTELNALGSGSNKLSGIISNDAVSELDLFADFELYVDVQTARSVGAYVAIYILIETDGTNYSYGGDALDPPASMLVGNFPLDAAVTARTVHLREVPLPPRNFKVLLQNNTGQAFAATLNTLKMSRYNYESA